MKSNYKRLGNYIQPIDIRNVEDKRYDLLGVSVEKRFIPSIANTVGTDWHSYKIIKKGQFCYIPDTSRRGEKIGIALLTEKEIGLVSAVYTVFEVVSDKLIPEYLMLWFKRAEFDRYARYHSHGSVREIFDWEEMCNVELPIPEIAEQQKIVDAYNTIEQRIAIKRQINDNLESQAQAFYKRKAMQQCKFFSVGEKCSIFTGKKDVNQAELAGIYKFFSCSPEYLYSNEFIYDSAAILIAGNGSYTGRVSFVSEPFDLYQRTYAVVPLCKQDEIMIYWVYACLLSTFRQEVTEKLHGSAIPYIVYNDIALHKVYFDESTFLDDCNFVLKLVNMIESNKKEITHLRVAIDNMLTLLSR